MADKPNNSHHVLESSSTAATPLNQYAALGQLSYAPTTQTKVVTTTTVVTTSFPPLVIKAPKHLHDRDPKQYPLAASPTPPSIKDFGFDVDGKLARFQEAEDLENTLSASKQKQSALQYNKGTVRSVTKSTPQYETPKKAAEQRIHATKAMDARLSAVSNGKKRISSPVSLAEAAELASLQRRSKKPRSLLSEMDGVDPPDVYPTHTIRSRLSETFDSSAPATPDTDAGSAGQFKIPKARSRSKRPVHKSSTHKGLQAEERPDGTRRPTHSLPGGGDSHLGTEFPTRTSRLVPGIAATPPIVESDLEPATPFETIPEHRRPTPLDTITAQDASLPSPSLSPITAAATLHNNVFSHQAEEDMAEDDTEVSGLDISQISQAFESRHDRGHSLGLPSPLALDTPEHQQAKPSIMDIPTMLDSFDAMPVELQTYVMYQFLRRCAKPTLQIVNEVVAPALKCDFLDLLPLELSMNIISNFDVRTMCRAAQVSKRWRQIVDSDEKAWKTLLNTNDIVLPEGEVERAVREGWGWQFPHGPDSYEEDLSKLSYDNALDTEFSTSSRVGASSSEYSVPSSTTRPKRKAAGKHSSHSSSKKRKTKIPSLTKTRTVAPWMKSLETAQGPIAYANAAAMAVPNPDVGLPSLRNLHLYKSLYRRHHAIKKGWMEEDTEPQHFAFRAHGRHVVTCLQFDTDKILTGSDDTKIHVYDTKSGALRTQLDGHEGGVWALQYDGNTLVSGSTDRSVRVWDIEKGKCLQVFQGHTSTVRCLVILKPTKIGEELDGTPIMMPKEPLIITGSRDSTLRVWKLPQPGDRSVFQHSSMANDSDNPYYLRSLVGHHHSVRAIAAHGDTVVSGSYDNNVRVWKVSDGQLLHRLVGHTAKVYSVVLDHERNRCISGSMDNAVKIWSLETGNMIHSLDGHTSLVGLLDLSFGRLVSAAADMTLRIWDPENGYCRSVLTAHTGAITCFQHDDQKVVSGSDRTVKMWNVQTGKCVRDLLTDLSGVWQVKFNERLCVAAVQRKNWTYLEVLDFGAARDGVPKEQRGVRTVVDIYGHEIDDFTTSDTDDANLA